MSDIKPFALDGDGAKELSGNAANLKDLDKAKPLVKQSYEQD